MDNKDIIIRDAQYRKGLSIAFFNATNAAVEFAKINGLTGILDPKKFIADWRDFFLEEHKNYYATVIAKIGLNYSPTEAIATLQATTNIEGLSNAWLLLSEDERHDEAVIAVKEDLKKKYEEKK